MCDCATNVPRLYSVKATAELLGLGVSKVYELVAEGELAQYVELGTTRSKIRIRSDDLKRFIDSRTITHGSRA